MKKQLLSFLVLMFCSGTGFGLTLRQALKQARTQALEVKQAEHLIRQANANAEGIDAAYDTTVFAEQQIADDKNQVVNAFSGNERTRRTTEIGTRKLFSTGTQVEFKLTHERNETLFADDDSSQQASADPAASQSPAFGANSVNFNPSYETRGEVTVSQELWRNFWGRELTLQKAVSAGAAVQPTFDHRLQEQELQSRVESLYWSAASLHEQHHLTKQLLEKSREFARQMSRRVQLGRADNVDEADAEANVVGRESSLIDLDIALNKTLRQLAIYLDPEQPPNLTSKDLSTSIEAGGPAVLKEAAAIQKAFEQRIDLQLVAAQGQIANAKRALGEEKGDPSVQLYASGSQNGIAEDASTSYDEISKLRHPSYTFGLRFEMPIGNTKSASEVTAAVEEASGLAAQKAVILRDIRRDLHVAYEELRGSQRKFDQAVRRIKTFERKRRQENIKLQQARSDRVTVIRYEMEVLTAKNEKIVAQKQMRDAEAQIRSLIHGYPSEL